MDQTTYIMRTLSINILKEIFQNITIHKCRLALYSDMKVNKI